MASEAVRRAAFLAPKGARNACAVRDRGKPHPWRERRARRRACRDRSGRTRRGRGRCAPTAGLSHDIPSQTRHATPYRIMTHRIYPRIYHATHPQKPPPPAPSRVSRILWTLATLTRGGPEQSRPHGASGGRGDAPAAAGAGARGGTDRSTPAPHGAPSGTSTARYAGAWPGEAFAAPHRRLPQAAFLASFGRSQRSQQPPPLSRSPQKTAHATASEGRGWDPPESERRPSPYRAQRGRP